MVLFSYVANRRIHTIDALLGGYHKYVQTDGLKGYKHLKNHIGCWVHAVRRFKQILKTNPKAENARRICKYAAKLYKIEEQERKHVLDNLITEEEFLVSRRIQAKSVIVDIKRFADSIREKYTKGSAMGKALNYLYEYWPTLTNYVDCYEASPSNNSAENAIRPFVCGRRGCLRIRSTEQMLQPSIIPSLKLLKPMGSTPMTTYGTSSNKDLCAVKQEIGMHCCLGILTVPSCRL